MSTDDNTPTPEEKAYLDTLDAELAALVAEGQHLDAELERERALGRLITTIREDLDKITAVDQQEFTEVMNAARRFHRWSLAVRIFLLFGVVWSLTWAVFQFVQGNVGTGWVDLGSAAVCGVLTFAELFYHNRYMGTVYAQLDTIAERGFQRVTAYLQSRGESTGD